MTNKHIKIAKRYTENIIFAFDNDSAGISATIRALKIAYEAEVFPKVLIIPVDFKDIDEYINSVLGTTIEFEEVD
jgi:DNA primase